MQHKKLVITSILCIVLIFITQALLIYKQCQISKDLLIRELNLACRDAYMEDFSNRFTSINDKSNLPSLVENSIIDNSPDYYRVLRDKNECYDKNSIVFINLFLEMYTSRIKPIKLARIDSIASRILRNKNINSTIYSQIIDKRNNKIIMSSYKESLQKSGLIYSAFIPLDIYKVNYLRLIMPDPTKILFSKMSGLLIVSFLLSLFCIYCLYFLQQTLSRQKKLAESRNDFYTQISHELKRPISIVYMATDSLLNSKIIDNPEKRDSYLKLSLDELKRMNKNIDMILTVSMNEEGMFHLNKTEFSPIQLIQEVKRNSMELATKPLSIDIVNRLGNLPINADYEHLYQCIINLVENSIKYSDKELKITMTLWREAKYFLISVQDNGMGINKENISTIFEKFNRVNAQTKIRGYGIGLNYIKQVVEKHKGHVRVESTLGKGTNFIIQLPIN